MVSDWLLKPRIAFAIYLPGTHAGFAPENVITVTGIN